MREPTAAREWRTASAGRAYAVANGVTPNPATRCAGIIIRRLCPWSPPYGSSGSGMRFDHPTSSSTSGSRSVGRRRMLQYMGASRWWLGARAARKLGQSAARKVIHLQDVHFTFVDSGCASLFAALGMAAKIERAISCPARRSGSSQGLAGCLGFEPGAPHSMDGRVSARAALVRQANFELACAAPQFLR